MMKAYPLLQSQMGIFLEMMAQPTMTKYNLPFYTIFPKTTDVKILSQSVYSLIGTRKELRTHFILDEQGTPRQYFDSDIKITIPVKSMTEDDAMAYIHHDFVRPFDILSGEPLIRLEIIQTEKNIYLLTDIHHSIADGITLSALYVPDIILGCQEKPLPTCLYGMYDCAEDEQQSFGTETYLRAKEYDAEKFAGVDFTSLCTDAVDRWGNDIQESLFISRAELDGWCAANGTSSNLLLMAAFSHVLSVFSRERKVAYHTINHGRTDKRLRNAYGMFVKSVPVCVDVDPQEKVTDFIKGFRRELMSTIRYGSYPFTHFCNDLKLMPTVSFGFQGADVLESIELDGTSFHLVQLTKGKTDEDLACVIYSSEDEYEIRVNASDALYTSEKLRTFASAVKSCAENMMKNTESVMQDISVVSSEEIQQILSISSGPTLDYDIHETFVDMFLRQVAQRPDAIAVVDENGSISYRELDRRSDMIASRLVSFGIARNEFVSIMTGCHSTFLAAAIGIEKAGAAYVPLDYKYPIDRLQYMLEDSESKVLITEHGIYEEKNFSGVSHSVSHTLFMDDMLSGKQKEHISPVNLFTPDGLAYMIYTSGSTGKPKGVMIPHRAKASFVRFIAKEWHLNASSRISCHSSYSFDASVEDLYPALTVGGTVYLVPEEVRMDIDLLYKYICDNGITGGSYSTQIGQILVQNYDLPVEYLVMGGEKMTVNPDCGIRLINAYGPTEFTVDATYYEIEHGRQYKNIPIGKPLYNQSAFIVDKYGNLLPQGVAGELCLMGTQMACGYWKREDLTEKAFTPCPFIPGKTMYHTGDLARRNEEGNLEYLGRIDNQVKLRGFRIEMGEIESCAMAFSDDIKSVAAEVKEINGTQHLCLYYESVGEISEDDLKAHMAKTLTEYMVPDAFIRLDVMPLTPNDKIDRKALPVPELKAEEIVAPETELEQQMFDVAARLLGHDQFGVTTNLIKVGLSSLLAMRMSVAIRQQLNLVVETKDILSTLTLRQLAAVAKDIDSTAEHVWEKREYYPITENQRGVYIDWELHRDTTQYNIPSAEKLPDMDAEQLRKALIKVVDAHPYLKTRFEMKDVDVVQRRNDEEPAAVELHVLDTEPDSAFFQQRIRPFNLLADRLYRIEVYQTPSSVYLFTDFHHTIFDGLSTAIFMSDLQKAYRGEQLQTETYSSYEHSLDEQQLMQGKTYEEAESYFDQLLDSVESLSYPHSQDVEGIASGSGTVQTEIDGSAIRSFCREHGLTENSYFLTVLLQVLHQVTRENSIQILSINNGRTDSRLSNAVGMFVKTLPIVSVLDTEKESKETVAELTDEMQNQFQKTQSLDFYPFTKMVERHHLRSEIMYVYQGGLFENASFENAANVTDLQLDTVKFPLNVTCYPIEKDGYGVFLEYDTSLYSQEDMEILASMLKTAAEESAEVSLVKEVSLVGAADKKNILSLSEGESLDYNREETFVDVFQNQVAHRPEAIAVVDENSSISYGELDRRSDILASKLQQLGIGKDNFVCLMLPRSLEFEVSILGVFKSGGAYVPLDSDYPNERLLYMLEDSESKVLITTHALFEEKQKTGDFYAANVLFVEDMDWSAEAEPVNASRPENLAYMIYTSGSTGKPKGVMVEHHSLRSFAEWRVRKLKLTPADHNIEHASFSFDASLDDLICPLAAGGQVHILPSSMRQDMDGIYHYICNHGITGMSVSAPLGMEMLNAYDLPLRYIAMGGEKLRKTKPSSVQVVNEYGPTEFTVCSSYHAVDSHREYKNIPIGRPVPNSSSFIVDKFGNLLPQGVSGELCLMGIQMSRGYWKREDLTEKAFTPCPFIPGQTMYHTGDLAKWNEEGELEYLGRIDNQVKLRGFRIEMGEIESRALTYSDAIKSVAAEVKEINGIQHLCLYYVSEVEVNEDDLKSHMAATLTEYMVPDAFIHLEVMPMTPNGKIDRRALPAVALNIPTENVAPSNVKEQILFDVVSKLLGTAAFGVTDNLHNVGLTSLLAIKLVAQAKNLGINLKASDVIKQNTIRKILTEEKSICYWAKPYSVDKPVVVLFYFLTPYNTLVPLREKLTEHFSVLIVESISDHFDYIFKEEDLNEVIEMYTSLIDYYVEGKSKVYAFVGHCLAGEVAYRSAIRWQQKTGEQIPVMMLNTNGLEFHRNENVDQLICYLPEQFRKNHADELKRKCADGNIVASLMVGNCPDTYDGEVIYYKATKESPMMFEKELMEEGEVKYVEKVKAAQSSHPSKPIDFVKYWRQFASNMDCREIDAEHVTMLGKDYVDRYADDLLSLKK